MEDHLKRRIKKLPYAPLWFQELIKSKGVLTGSMVFGDPDEAEDIDYCIMAKSLPPSLQWELFGFWHEGGEYSDLDDRFFECFYFKFKYTSKFVNVLVFSELSHYLAYVTATRILRQLKGNSKKWDEMLENKSFRIHIFESIVDHLIKPKKK